MLKATIIKENEMWQRQHKNVRQVHTPLFLMLKPSVLWCCSSKKQQWKAEASYKAESGTGANSSQRRAVNCNVSSGYQRQSFFLETADKLFKQPSAFWGMWAFLGKVLTSLVLGSLPAKGKYREKEVLWSF